MDLGALRDAAFAHRHRQITREQRQGDRARSGSSRRTIDQADWVVLFEDVTPLGTQRLEMHVKSGRAIHASSKSDLDRPIPTFDFEVVQLDPEHWGVAGRPAAADDYPHLPLARGVGSAHRPGARDLRRITVTTHPKRIIDAHCHIGEIPPWKFYDLEHPVKPTVYDYRSADEFVKNHMDEFNIERALTMSNYGVPVHEISFDLNDVMMDAATNNDRVLGALWVSFLPRNAEMTRKALKLAGESRVVALKTTFLLGGNPDPGTSDEDAGDRRRGALRRLREARPDLPLPHEPGRQLGHQQLHPARREVRQALQDLPGQLRRASPTASSLPVITSTSLSGLIERIRFSLVRSLHSTLTNLVAMASVFADTRLRNRSSNVMPAMDSRWNNEPVASE